MYFLYTNMINNTTNTEQLNKLIANSIILHRDRITMDLETINKLLLGIVTGPEYENNKLNVKLKGSVNYTNIVKSQESHEKCMSAQDLINEAK